MRAYTGCVELGTIHFIGGGNMASAIIGGLVKAGHRASAIRVVDPAAEQRARLAAQYGVEVNAATDGSLGEATIVVWAVKPQLFREAAAPCAPYAANALHLSVMAGIRSDAVVAATGSQRVVRAMPNTPALIGCGVCGLYAREAVTPVDRATVERVLHSTGELLWFSREQDLDAVTALSGSGPAYVFYFVEAMVQAAVEMGLTAEQGKRLALATFAGAAALAQQSTDSPTVLRERVTSRGGTTHAALTSLEADRVGPAFVKALHAARRRAKELGDAFGA
jgi:pyrroline-5-carboxylate reductase